jgi:hypothetical protein
MAHYEIMNGLAHWWSWWVQNPQSPISECCCFGEQAFKIKSLGETLDGDYCRFILLFLRCHFFFFWSGISLNELWVTLLLLLIRPFFERNESKPNWIVLIYMKLKNTYCYIDFRKRYTHFLNGYN